LAVVWEILTLKEYFNFLNRLYDDKLVWGSLRLMYREAFYENRKKSLKIPKGSQNP